MDRSTRRKSVGGALALVLGLGVGMTGSLAGAGEKVTICHRDNNTQKPWGPKAIEVDLSAVDGVGNGDHFLEHTGPLPTTEAEAEALKDQFIQWGDIIPPVPGVHDGLNWTEEGQAILANDCQFVVTPPTTQPPVEPPVQQPESFPPFIVATPGFTG